MNRRRATIRLRNRVRRLLEIITAPFLALTQGGLHGPHGNH